MPGDHRLATNRAHALWLADEPEAALAACDRALQLQPQASLALRNRANILRDLNRFEEADAAYRACMDGEAGGEPITAWSRSQTLIGLERYGEAYRLAERRFGVGSLRPWRPGPYWQGWPTGDGADPRPQHDVVVWSEQGLGDSLQYVRWIPELPKRGQRIRLEVEPALMPLLREGLARLGDALTVAPRGCPPDPRWLRDREDSPWYPTLTLLRQPAHRDWPGLVRQVLERFRAWLGPRSGG
jgi:tetratricopeptide (TPR) repeat protein